MTFFTEASTQEWSAHMRDSEIPGSDPGWAACSLDGDQVLPQYSSWGRAPGYGSNGKYHGSIFSTNREWLGPIPASVDCQSVLVASDTGNSVSSQKHSMPLQYNSKLFSLGTIAHQHGILPILRCRP